MKRLLILLLIPFLLFAQKPTQRTPLSTDWIDVMDTNKDEYDYQWTQIFNNAAFDVTFDSADVRILTADSIDVADLFLLDAGSQLNLSTGGDDYIIAAAGGDTLDFYAGGANMIRLIEDTADTIRTTAAVIENVGGFSIEEQGNSNQLYLATGGNVGIGTASPDELLHLYSSSDADMTIETEADGDNSVIWFERKRASAAIVQSGNDLGTLYGRGWNGTGYDIATEISFEVDGTPGASTDMPGRVIIQTTPDGSATPTEAVRWDSNQKQTNAGNLQVNGQGYFSADGDTFKIDLGTVEYPLFLEIDNTQRFGVDSTGGIVSGHQGTASQNFVNTVIYKDLTLDGAGADTVVTNGIPQGYAIDNIIFKNTTANQITNFSIGFSDGGAEIVAAANVSASDEGSLTILQRIDDFDAADTFYFNADNWNSANLEIYVRMVRYF